MPNLNSISPRWKGIFAALLSTALIALALPGRPFPILAWIAMVPLALALRNAHWLDGFLLGGIVGFLLWLNGAWWIQVPIREMLQFSPGAAFVLMLCACAISALPYAIAGALASVQRGNNSPVFRAAKNAAIFTVAVSWWPQLFDGNLASTQYKNALAIQAADLGGVALILFAIYWVNWLMAECIATLANRESELRSAGLHPAVSHVFNMPDSNCADIVRSVENGALPVVNRRYSRMQSCATPALVLCAVLAGIFGYGAFRLGDFSAQQNAAPKEAWFTIGAIQPNIPVPVSAARQPIASSELTNNFFSSLQQAVDLVQLHPEIDLLAFPENPDFFAFQTDAPRRNALAKTILLTGKPAIFNANLLDGKKQIDGKPAVYNINIFVDASATVTNSYRKMKLVPVVESLFWEERFPWLRKIFPNSIGVLPGAEPVVFDVKPGVRVMPLICYEATHSAFARQFVKKGGSVIVNLVNDSWFLKTPASENHLALALFRAVELRVPLVRVTNSGVGAFIQADGRIVPGSRTALFEKTSGAFPVFIPAQRSFYANYGNVFLIGLTVAVTAALIRDAWKFFANRRMKLQPGNDKKLTATTF